MGDTARLAALRDEATRRFVGHGAVHGVASDDGSALVLLLSRDDPEQESLVRRWAVDRHVAVRVLVTGGFSACAGPGDRPR